MGHTIRRYQLSILFVVFLLQGTLDPEANRATLNFPSSIDFHLRVFGDQAFETAEIETRTDALTCSQNSTRAVADEFESDEITIADWSWNLKESGALPPGTMVWWQWVLQDEDGNVYRTQEESLTIEDDSHNWRKIGTESLVVYWYDGDQAFAQTLLDAGEQALDRLDDQLGVGNEGPVRMYIYASPEDMQGATLYAPAWSGGLAFVRYNAVLMAIDPEETDWGPRVVAHELTHVVVGRHTFSCVESTPIWFDEGLSMVMEGPVEPGYTLLLDQAIEDDTLLSVKELGFIFSGQSELASLSYAQSASLVGFLIDEYGKDNLLLLLDEFKQGTPEDRALQVVYGVDRDGLEAAWRESIGAAPMQAEAESDRPEPTIIPTVLPIDGIPQPGDSVPVTPDYITESQLPENPFDAVPSTPIPALGTYLFVGVIGCSVLMLGVVVMGLVLIWRARNRRKPDPYSESEMEYPDDDDDDMV